MRYSPLSTASTNSSRDMSWDLSDALETGETISGTPTVTSSSANLTVSGVGTSSDDLSVVWSVAVATEDVVEDVTLTIAYVGTAGSGDTYTHVLPLVASLTN